MKKNKFIFFAQILMLVWALNLHFSVYGQTAKPAAELQSKGFEELKLDSKLMKREMPYRVILPVNYNNSNEKTFYPVVYLLHGLTGSYNNWTNQSKLVEYAKNYEYIIVTAEGANGWYSDSATVENDRYESYIVQELMPEIERKFRAAKTRENRAIAGLSMGGYGSLKFGLKYPEKFVLAGSFSGALRAAEWTEKEIGNSGWKVLVDSITSVYGAADSETRRQNDIFKILGAKSADEAKNLPFFYIDCGTEDFLIQQSRDFTKLLADKKVPHEFRELPGIHDWKFWDSQVQEFLRVSRKFIGAAKAKSN